MKLIVTEKAVRMIEAENVITFQTDKQRTKADIKKEVEEIFEVKVEKVKTLIRNNKKHAYIKLKKDFLAIDLATKLGAI